MTETKRKMAIKIKMKSMRVNRNSVRLLHSALTHFIGKPILETQDCDDMIYFEAAGGSKGYIEKNFNGSWSIWEGDDLIYDIEPELFDLINLYNDESTVIDLYNDLLRNIVPSDLKKKSRVFFNTMKDSLEKILLFTEDSELEGETMVGVEKIIYHNGFKIKINQN